ncbi:MAG: hypothetical protein WC089_03075 [Candidatus Paceibacterota bacterium]
MPEQVAQEAPKKLSFENDFTLIRRYRILYVDHGSIADATKQEEKKEGKPTKEIMINSVTNLSGIDLKMKQASRKSEISIDVRMMQKVDITLLQAYHSIGKTREIIIPEDRIMQIIHSLSRSCLDFRGDIYKSPTRTVNFFVKQKVKKLDEKRTIVYRVIMTKGKKFDIVILSLQDPEIIKGEAGHLFAIDYSLKH